MGEQERIGNSGYYFEARPDRVLVMQPWGKLAWLIAGSFVLSLLGLASDDFELARATVPGWALALLGSALVLGFTYAGQRLSRRPAVEIRADRIVIGGRTIRSETGFQFDVRTLRRSNSNFLRWEEIALLAKGADGATTRVLTRRQGTEQHLQPLLHAVRELPPASDALPR